jgi:hypothetical protein
VAAWALQTDLACRVYLVFVQDLFYLTGLNQPAVAVLQVLQPEVPGGTPRSHFVLFIEAPDPDVSGDTWYPGMCCRYT